MMCAHIDRAARLTLGGQVAADGEARAAGA